MPFVPVERGTAEFSFEKCKIHGQGGRGQVQELSVLDNHKSLDQLSVRLTSDRKSAS